MVLIYTWWVVSAQSTHERAYYSEVSIPLGESHAHRLCPPLSMSGRGRLQSKRGRSRIKEEELRRVRISLSRATSGRRDEVYPLPTHARPRVSVSTFERYQGCFQQLKMRQSAGWYWCWIFRRPQETSNSYGCHADALAAEVSGWTNSNERHYNVMKMWCQSLSVLWCSISSQAPCRSLLYEKSQDSRNGNYRTVADMVQMDVGSSAFWMQQRK